MKFKIILLLLFYVYNVNCITDDKCNFQTCGECISNTRDICVWCSKDNMTGPRCIPLHEVNTTRNIWCGGTYDNPISYVTVLDNEPFNETIQIKPQRIKIKTRPGFENKFTIYFKPAKDYPLDIYYLVDISHTMKSENQKLQDQAQEIYDQLKNYTNNVRLGFGSFVEKPGFPLYDGYRVHDKRICHSFKNELSLTNNMTLFTTAMKNLEFGGNYDDPEAGLDGLMQAMVCTKQLDWRTNARRIIVLSTDATYHSAGDGKTVGAIKPNDMQCHLENDVYNETQALTYDYPSVSEIDRIASKGNFKIVFATKTSVSKEYQLLAHSITGAKYADLERGKDALKIIKEAYLESAKTAHLHTKLPPFIQLTVDQRCDIKPTRNCESTPEKRIVEIEGKLLVKYCPPDNVMKRELIIKVHDVKDNLTIDLEIDCQCDCEKLQSTGNSHKCHDAGFIQCGICKCNPGSYGNDCRCNGTSDIVDMEKCMLNKDEKNLCSGRGTCRCGKCEACSLGFSGDYCQFDDTACPRRDKILCSNNGICTRGQCECNSLWTGADCSCPLDESACITPYSKKVCSGQGKCVCGNCECDKLPDNKDGTTYTGSYCDICDGCGEKHCKELEEYVMCNIINNKPFCDQEYNTTDTVVYFLNTTEINGPEWNRAQYCTKKLENDSCIIFKFKYDDGNVVLGIQNELELAPKANIFIAVGAALGTVLLIGIITLIVWKILIDIHDKKEYEKFAKESTAQGFEVYCNDLYEPPGSTFTNPAFKGS